jgi:serine/threonine-protein kinase
MGSPLYMSPEQMRSTRDVDHRTDIWSLGVIVFELLAGRTAFRGETLPELVASIMTEPALSLKELRPDVPLELESVVMRCLDKNRDLRFQNVGELAAALVPFAPRRARAIAERVCKVVGSTGVEELTSLPAGPQATRNIGPVAQVAPAHPGASTRSAWSETQDPGLPRRSAKWVWLVAGAGLLLGVGGVVLFRAQTASEPPAETAAAPPSASAQTGTPAANAAVAANPTPPSIEVTPVPPAVVAVTPAASASEPNAEAIVARPAPQAPVKRRESPRKTPAVSVAAAANPSPAAPPPSPPSPAPAESKPAKRNPLAIDLK